MSTKLAGRLPLQDMISGVLNDAKSKLAAEEKKEEKKVPPFMKKKEESKEDKKEDKKEESKEKMSSAIDFSDSSEIEKLASAVDFIGDTYMKIAADSVENGGEAPQGGTVLATISQHKGVQAYKKDQSKSHNVPMTTPLQADPSQGPAATQAQNNHAKAPGGGGTQKVAAQSKEEEKGEKRGRDSGGATGSLVGAAHGAVSGYKAGWTPSTRAMMAAGRGFGGFVLGGAAGRHLGGSVGKTVGNMKGDYKNAVESVKKKKASVDGESNHLDYILNKMAESAQGGMTLDSKSGEGPKPPSGPAGGNDARGPLESNQAAINMKKVDGKKPQKRMLAEVLSEPAYSKAQDSKVHENLQNASKGGVKIAEARVLLQKIAEEGCKCSDAGTCKYCKMKAAMSGKKKEKISRGGVPPPTSTPPGMSGSITGTN